jgi:hypothetical protein
MNRLFSVSLLVFWLSTGRAAAQGSLSFRFAKSDLDKVPAGWQAAQTGEGKGGVWKVVADDTAPSKTGLVLAQVAAAPSKIFNLCLYQKAKFKDVEVSVAFKAVKGDIDEGGGVVWRCKDPKNYYIARMNPLEENYRLYKVVDGKRIQLATKEDLKVPVGQWHTLKITHVGKRIECFLDGKKIFDVADDAFGSAGLIGLWTKADAYTYFDQIHAGPAERNKE